MSKSSGYFWRGEIVDEAHAARIMNIVGYCSGALGMLATVSAILVPMRGLSSQLIVDVLLLALSIMVIRRSLLAARILLGLAAFAITGMLLSGVFLISLHPNAWIMTTVGVLFWLFAAICFGRACKAGVYFKDVRGRARATASVF